MSRLSHPQPTICAAAARFAWLRALLFAAALLAARPALGQTIIYVNAAAAPGGNGQSWATAYQLLDSALAEASQSVHPAGVEVWVAAGTYVPQTTPLGGGVRDRTFALLNTVPVSLFGGFNGTEQQRNERNLLANPTILSGDIQGNDAPGYVNYADNCYCVLILRGTAETVVEGITVRGANGNGTGAMPLPSASIGAMRIDATLPACTVRFCVVQDNTNNRPNAGACGIYASNVPDITLDRCIVVRNRSQSTTADEARAGVYLNDCDGQITGCMISDNLAPGMLLRTLTASGLHVVNCTVANNTVTNQSGYVCAGIYLYDGVSNVTIANSIVWGNLTDGSLARTSQVYRFGNGGDYGLSHSSVQNWDNFVGGPANDGADPMFVNPGAGDYRPSAGSLVVNSGDTGAVPSFLATDVLMRRRVNGLPDGTLGVVDRGAYELNSLEFSPRLYVLAAAGGANDGSSWESAFSGDGGLRSALALAGRFSGAFEEIWIGAGTYTPSPPLGQGGSRSVSFELPGNLSIYGGFAGNETELSQRDIAANETVLSGDLNGDDVGDLNRDDNSLHVLRAESGVSPSVLDGFTIFGGNANGIGEDGIGGGLLAGDVVVRACRFVANSASGTGGGGCGLLDGTSRFSDCDWLQNSAANGDPGYGGGVYAPVGNVVFERCRFEHNRANAGGGVYSTANLGVARSTFIRNTASTPVVGRGGGLVSAAGSIVNTSFLGNRAWGNGGGADVYGSVLSVANCEFVGNIAEWGTGGGLHSLSGDVFNCTFVGNRTVVDIGAAMDARGGGRVASNLARANQGVGLPVEIQQVRILLPEQSNPMFNSVEGWSLDHLGTGNNGLDPRFRRMPSPGADGVWGTIDDDYGDLRLTNGSPAIDSGDSTAVPLDTYDIDGDGNTTESLPLDLDGLSRFVDDPLVANSGVGSPPVDRGAYEFVPPVVTQPGDRRWVSPEGGDFASLLNWFPAVPGALDNAVFDIPGAYTVSFAPLPPTVTRTARISAGHPTFDLNGATYSLSSVSDPALIVGDQPDAAAMLTITDGTLAPFSARIGSEPGSAGVVAVSGAGARLTIAQDDLAVGFFGQGHLVVSEGGRVVSRTAGVGDQPGSEGSTAVVTGAGSTWSIPFFLAINNGSVTVSDGGTLSAGFGVFLFQNGTISGNGTIDADVVNFGTLAPGNSPGTLTIAGDYEQVGIIPELGANSGRLRMEVSGPAANQHDQLVVTGAATLGGGLFVEFTDGYAPQPDGQGNFPSFRLLESSSPLTSRFDVAFFPPVPAIPGEGAKFLRAIYPNRGPGAVDLVIADLGINPDFNDPDTFEILGGPTAAAVGDLNRDGLPDLAITLPDTEDPDNNDGVLVILFNQGLDNDDQWLGFGAATQVNVQKFPSGVAIGDFDGVDGNDVAVVNMRSNTLNIISQQIAAGTFDNALTLPTGLEPTSVAAFNLDRTGRIDLGVTDGGDDTVGMYANSNLPGTPGFTRTTIPVGMRPKAIRPFNPDNDKDVDCAIVNNGSAALSVLPNLGFGTFGPAITIPVGADPVGIIAAPLLDRAEGDNREDLVVVNRDGGSVSVIVNTTPVATTDALSFAPAVESVLDTTNPAGAQPGSLAVVDMDDDGDRDLAVLARASDDSATVVRVLRNDLNGGEQLAFAESAELAAGLGPVAVLSADVDGDGRQDLITVNAQGPRGPGAGSVQTLRSALEPPPTVCAADFDQNGELQVADIFSFLTGWFNNIPSAYNFGGTPGVPAIFAFLAAWFAGC